MSGAGNCAPSVSLNTVLTVKVFQLIGMSKKRVLCTLTGQEMLDSSDTDDDDDDQLSDTDPALRRSSKKHDQENNTYYPN